MTEGTQKEALVRTVPQRTFSLVPSSLGEAREIATLIANSDFAPKDYKGKPDNVLVAIQMGADLGLKPMQALQNVAVINGRPSIYGDAALALVMPVLERFYETFEGEKGTDGYTAVCIAKRKGWPDETRRTFSIADAKKANLWGKPGPWTNYSDRMQQFRARGWTLRDVGADLLLGLVLAEEAQDYPSVEGTVISSEVVPSVPPVVSLLERVPEALRDNIGKAFAELKMSTPNADGIGWTPNGLGMAKINEFLAGAGVDPEAGGLALLEWCRDEFAKRKTGAPRKKKDEGNGKAKKADAGTEAAVGPAAGGETAGPAGVGAAGSDSGSAPAKAEPKAEPKAETKTEAVKPVVEESEALF